MAESRPLVSIPSDGAPYGFRAASIWYNNEEGSDLEELEGAVNVNMPDYRWIRTRCAVALIGIAMAGIAATAWSSGSFTSQKHSYLDADALLVRADIAGKKGSGKHPEKWGDIAAAAMQTVDPAGTKPPVLRVTCIGDSLTAGMPFGPETAYPERLQAMLGPGYLFMNYGDPGKTVMKKSLCSGWPDAHCYPLDEVGTCDFWSTTLWTATLNSSPDIVLIMFGTNDAKGCNWNRENFIRDYVAMVRGVKRIWTKPKVYLIEPPPLFPPFPGNISKDVINVQFRWMIPEIARQSGADGIIDAWTYLGGGNWQMMHTMYGGQCFKVGENCTEDGCHLSRSGYNALAELVKKEVFTDATTQETTTAAPLSGKQEVA